MSIFYFFLNSWWREQSSFYKEARRVGYLLFPVLLESVFCLKCFTSNGSLLLNIGLMGHLKH